jgi:hypothetical protein
VVFRTTYQGTFDLFITSNVSFVFSQRELAVLGDIGRAIIFSIYDFDSLRVQCRPAVDTDSARLRPTPRNAEELADYAMEVVNALMSLDDDEREEIDRLTIHPCSYVESAGSALSMVLGR